MMIGMLADMSKYAKIGWHLKEAPSDWKQYPIGFLEGVASKLWSSGRPKHAQDFLLLVEGRAIDESLRLKLTGLANAVVIRR